MRKRSPSARTRDWLKDAGYTVGEAESTMRTGALVFKRDLFGFCDFVALRDGETVCVQATSRSNVSARVAKIADHENVAAIRKAGWGIWVIGWDEKTEPRVVDLS